MAKLQQKAKIIVAHTDLKKPTLLMAGTFEFFFF